MKENNIMSKEVWSYIFKELDGTIRFDLVEEPIIKEIQKIISQNKILNIDNYYHIINKFFDDKLHVTGSIENIQLITNEIDQSKTIRIIINSQHNEIFYNDILHLNHNQNRVKVNKVKVKLRVCPYCEGKLKSFFSNGRRLTFCTKCGMLITAEDKPELYESLRKQMMTTDYFFLKFVRETIGIESATKILKDNLK